MIKNKLLRNLQIRFLQKIMEHNLIQDLLQKKLTVHNNSLGKTQAKTNMSSRLINNKKLEIKFKNQMASIYKKKEGVKPQKK